MWSTLSFEKKSRFSDKLIPAVNLFEMNAKLINIIIREPGQYYLPLVT